MAISFPAISAPGGVSYVPGTIVPSDGAVVTNGASETLVKADGTGNLASLTLTVSGGSVQNAKLPANKAVLTDQQASIDVTQYDGSGTFAMTVAVANNAQTLTLANGTTRILVDQLPIGLQSSAGVSTGQSATIGITSGALVGLKLAANVAVVVNAVGLTVPVTGTFTTTITPQVNASGVITGFTLS